MATIKRFEDVDAWNVSRELCNSIGSLIDNGSFQKNYRLIGQIEGSSGSIMDNIPEGFERGTRLEFIQFLGYSKVLVENYVLNCTEPSTENVLIKNNLMNSIH